MHALHWGMLPGLCTKPLRCRAVILTLAHGLRLARGVGFAAPAPETREYIFRMADEVDALLVNMNPSRTARALAKSLISGMTKPFGANLASRAVT